MGDHKTPSIDLNKFTLPSELRIAISKFINLKAGEEDNVLSTADFAALDEKLLSSPGEFDDYCIAVQKLYTALDIELTLSCASHIGRFADESEFIVNSVAQRATPIPSGAALLTQNYNEETILAALEYAGRILVSTIESTQYYIKFRGDGFELKIRDNHYTISRYDTSIEFDIYPLESGNTAIDNMSVKISGQETAVKDWPKLITGFLLRTAMFEDLSYCHWRMLDTGLILFDTNKAELKKFAKIYIEAVANILKKYPSLKIEIIGHADRVGRSEFNKALAANRAAAVRDELVRLGIDANRLSLVSMGEDDPVDDKADNKVNQYNRNVQLKVRYKYPSGRYAAIVGYKMDPNGNIILEPDLLLPDKCKQSTVNTKGTFGE